jgi:hypothetical protein
MAIQTLDQYIAAAKQRVQWMKSGGRTTVANGWFSLFDVAGAPGAGTLAGSSVAAGVVPTASTPGCPALSAFGGAALGYLSKIEFANTVPCRILIADMLFKAGAYAFNAAQALSSQPVYSGRLPNTDYKGLEIWAEQVTAATGNQAVNVTYTNESAVAGHTTGAVGIGAAQTVGRCWQLPLQAGDAGVQAITNVAGSVATVGTFNILVLRPLWSGRVGVANGGDVHDLLRTGLPQIYATSALVILVCPDSTAAGVPEFSLEVANA